MRRYWSLIVVLMWMGIVLIEPALAKNVSVMIPMTDVSVSSNERGNYYVVKFDLPAELVGKRLDSVFLEFVIDASPTTEAVEGGTPFVSVYPLKETFTGANLNYKSEVSSVKPVPMGLDQNVRADITDSVKGWLASPSSNHGLVIGALTGPPVGTLTLKDAALGPSAAVRVTYFYQNRSGERMSTK